MKPFDREAIRRACAETGGIVTVEEHVLEGGLGSAVGEAILDNGAWPRACVRLGIGPSYPSVVGSQEYLRRVCGIDAASIVAAVMRVVRPTVIYGPDWQGRLRYNEPDPEART